MEIKYGTSRAVLLLPRLGLALKFPRVYLGTALRQFYLGYVKRRFWRGLAWFVTAPTSDVASCRHLLFRGIVENWNEYSFSRNSENPFAWPTRFSLFGLCNVQPLGEPPAFTETHDIYRTVLDIAGDDLKDGHCFSDANNYAVSADGRLFLLDYASENSRYVLQRHGDSLRVRFAQYRTEAAVREAKRVNEAFY